MLECPHCDAAVEEGVGNICPVCQQDMLLPKSAGAPRPLAESPPPLPRASTPQPPPLPPQRPKPKARPRPAHLLLTELEAKGHADPSIDMSLDMPLAEIAKAEVEKPPVPVAKRGVSDRVIRVVATVVIAAGIFGVYWTTRSEPEPEVKVDAELQARVERQRQAVEALETGHALVLEGPAQADAAIAAYAKALELSPRLAAAERGLGISYAAKKDQARAVKHYRRYLELEPEADDAAQVKKIIADYRRAQKRRAASGD